MSTKPIGIFDSGVGGLTIASEIIKAMPQENFIYFGDTQHNPYGPRPLSQVKCYVDFISAYLAEERECKAIVIACNTAAIAGKEMVRQKYNIPVLGPVGAGARAAVQETKNGRIGVVATEGTIKSGAYREAILEVDENMKVFGVMAPRFVPLVENGEFSSQRVREVAREYLQELLDAGIDTLILGCTHYPYLTEAIQEVVGDEVNVIFPGEAIALELKEKLEESGEAAPSENKGEGEFLVSDLEALSPEFLKTGPQSLGLGELSFSESDVFHRPKTVVLGVIGADVHAVGNRILEYALDEAGFKVANIGVMASQEEFINAAIETGAEAILVSSLYGHGEMDCRGLKEKCVEMGLEDIYLYIGGNLVIGKQSWPEVREKFKNMGFDRVYPPGTTPDEAINDLRRDLYCGN